MATVLNKELDLTLNQTSDGTLVTTIVTAEGVSADYDFTVLVDVSLVRQSAPAVTEHYFVANKYTAGSWVGTDTFHLAITPATSDADTVTAKAYGSYSKIS
ncbi:hypothetical protein [Clostridium magnum]|uniref:Uncharacterized protein n=1 Tax=Clostridium magnum DSM 2767 TaxID=1121326 RepID=A0A162SM41_9CLOT|nr:hypothetical protein [Clostridium magnum]KZL91599.1 hypothetical protein CLMAG_33580 [Clostridium magnum DSM 2767]SHH49049.1 hypothetical protein SAMN02745944_00796 [Clostridium magnum DSM 2767]